VIVLPTMTWVLFTVAAHVAYAGSAMRVGLSHACLTYMNVGWLRGSHTSVLVAGRIRGVRQSVSAARVIAAQTFLKKVVVPQVCLRGHIMVGCLWHGS
jgi:hypothetical protein